MADTDEASQEETEETPTSAQAGSSESTPSGADADSITEQITASTATGVSEAHPVEFPQASRSRAHAALPIERFADVSIELSVEIGRVTMPIGELLQLGEGAVVELERSVAEPVDVMAQGVRIASGEVVVIDDRFAVRLTEIAHVDEGKDAGRPSRDRIAAT
ncbi:MAG: flagellar motor switch protein FliN [Planctomycetaceae bacterium]|nr:flagellar motor switch protein FliN [Planctomycetaceae bacterium]